MVGHVAAVAPVRRGRRTRPAVVVAAAARNSRRARVGGGCSSSSGARASSARTSPSPSPSTNTRANPAHAGAASASRRRRRDSAATQVVGRLCQRKRPRGAAARHGQPDHGQGRQAVRGLAAVRRRIRHADVHHPVIQPVFARVAAGNIQVSVCCATHPSTSLVPCTRPPTRKSARPRASSFSFLLPAFHPPPTRPASVACERACPRLPRRDRAALLTSAAATPYLLSTLLHIHPTALTSVSRFPASFRIRSNASVA